MDLSMFRKPAAAKADAIPTITELPRAEHPAAKTGRNAQRSVQDRWAREQAKPTDDRDQDAAFPINARAQRRARARGLERQMARGRRRFVQRELLQERINGDLHQQFLIADGKVPGVRAIAVHRVLQTLAGKRATLVHADQERYDKEFSAYVEGGKKGDAPKPPMRHEEADAQLRALAAQAPAARTA